MTCHSGFQSNLELAAQIDLKSESYKHVHPKSKQNKQKTRKLFDDIKAEKHKLDEHICIHFSFTTEEFTSQYTGVMPWGSVAIIYLRQ